MDTIIRRMNMLSQAAGQSRVEYITNPTLEEFINTGFTPNAKTRVVVVLRDFQHTSTMAFGGRNANDVSMFCVGSHSEGTIRFDYGTKSGNNQVKYTYTGGVGDHTLEINNGVCKVDGTTVYTFRAAVKTFTGAQPIHIFGMNNGGTHVNMLKSVKIVSAQIYDNGTLVRDFVPYRVGTVGYMKDNVSGTLYANAGGGAFTYGQDIH